MSFFVSLGLMLLSVVFLVVGYSTSASWAFVAAAAVAAGAVVLLWKRASREKFDTFVTGPPRRREPKLDTPFREPVESTQDVVDVSEGRSLGVPGYDRLTAAEILPSLETLSVEQLRAVIAHERRGLGRTTVLERAERLIELTGAVVVSPPGASIAAPGDPGRPTRRSHERSKDGPEMTL